MLATLLVKPILIILQVFLEVEAVLVKGVLLELVMEPLEVLGLAVEEPLLILIQILLAA